jgi:N-acetylglucosaminyl-diphospho-decaprenol L-rhamnosyltransferase
MIAISIVSHGHGEMLPPLVARLKNIPLVKEIFLTFNIKEETSFCSDEKVTIIQNREPIGFGANHNQAFRRCTQKYFAVINPDIVILEDPFPELVRISEVSKCGVVAPVVLDNQQRPDDSMRRFLTISEIVKRRFIQKNIVVNWPNDAEMCTPDWVGGMFMFFKSSIFQEISGYDEKYFMYCEDADICTRIWIKGYLVMGCLKVSVVHNARRSSHRSLEHFYWHVKSILRYLLRYRNILWKLNSAKSFFPHNRINSN